MFTIILIRVLYRNSLNCTKMCIQSELTDNIFYSIILYSTKPTGFIWSRNIS